MALSSTRAVRPPLFSQAVEHDRSAFSAGPRLVPAFLVPTGVNSYESYGYDRYRNR